MQKKQRRVNLHELANCSSRIPRTINRQKRVSKFTDKLDDNQEIPPILQQHLEKYESRESSKSSGFSQNDNYHHHQSKQRRHFNKFSNEPITDHQEIGFQQLSSNMDNEYVNKYFNVDDKKYSIISQIQQKLKHIPYRINNSVYQDICDQLEQEQLSKINETLNNPSFNLEEYVQKDMKEIGLVMDEEDLGNFNSEFDVLFIRHAFSKINYFYEKHRNLLKSKFVKQHFRFRLFKDSNSFIDSDLHDYGIQQCQIKQNKVNNVSFYAIFVSPMARAMQTCIELFRNHPQKDQITFYVNSNLGEMLKKDSDIFDKEKFIVQVDEAQQLGINFNTNQYFNPSWQEQLIIDQYGLQVDHLEPQFIKEILLEIFPQPLEEYHTFKKRSLSALRDIQNTNIDNNNLKIGIISHSLVQNNMFQQLGVNFNHEIGNLQFYYHKYL